MDEVLLDKLLSDKKSVNAMLTYKSSDAFPNFIFFIAIVISFQRILPL